MKTLTLAKSLPIAVCGAALLLAGTTGSAQALTLTATDQGWWATSSGHGSSNGNYITGQLGGQSFRNYFTFNLTGVPGGEAVTSAVLKLTRFNGVGNSPKDFGLFDVSTSATALDQNSAPNPTIFNDLGTGTSYGTYSVSTIGNSAEILSFALNSNGIAAINGSLGNSFSIGGALLGSLGAGSQYLFGDSNSSLAQLDLGTAPTAIPTPALLPGLIAMGVGVLRKRKAEAAKGDAEA